MISCIFFLNNRGDIVLARQFRDSLSARSLAENFRSQLLAKLWQSNTRLDHCAPVNIIDGTCYIHMTIGDVVLVMTSKDNVHCMAAVQYSIRLAQVFVHYFRRVSEATIRENFPIVLALIDESMDFGYPLLTDAAGLKQFIIPNVSSAGIDTFALGDVMPAEKISKAICGSSPWRAKGLVYHDNEVFVDVTEEMNMLLSRYGEVLTSSVVGKVYMKNFLSGMPECELHLNTRVFGDSSSLGFTETSTNATRSSLPSNVDDSMTRIEDVAFHPCVRLPRFDEEQVFRFVPPDGDFLLMSYTSSVNVSPPLSIFTPRFEEISSTRTEIQFGLKAEFSGDRQVAETVRLYIPCPASTANVTINIGRGRAKYLPASHEILWKLEKVQNGEEIPFVAETKQVLLSSTEQPVWEKPPIRLAFEFLSESLTGLRIKELPVKESEYRYQARKWIQYKTKSGSYECRISSDTT